MYANVKYAHSNDISFDYNKLVPGISAHLFAFDLCMNVYIYIFKCLYGI